MRNMAVLHSPAFSYPLPVLVRVLFNLLIFKGKILYYNKYSEKFNKVEEQFILYFLFTTLLSSLAAQSDKYPSSPPSSAHVPAP